MRLSTLLLLMTTLQLTAVSYSQTSRVSMKIVNGTIADVFSEIEKQSDFSIFYKDNQLDVTNIVNLVAQNQPIHQVLSETLKSSNSTFKVLDKIIVITPFEAQQRSISGNVTDETGTPLPGVSIMVKGTVIGSITDLDGNFELILPDDAQVLIFSFMGMRTQEVTIGEVTVFNIVMQEDVFGIEEVVVVGYGTMQKSDLTGSISNVNISEELVQLPNVSIVQALQGAVPGLNIGAVNSAGQDPTISVRGYSNLSTSAEANAPLIVLDGVIYRGNLVDLNTNDILSISVLKDASSAAIYGSQASNGVVLITTKKGTITAKPAFQYSNSFTLQVPHNVFEPMGRDELEQFILDVNWDRGSRLGPDYLQPDPDFSFVPYLKTSLAGAGYLSGVDNDWWGMFTENGHIVNHNLNLTGRTQQLGYFISGGVSDVQGYFKNDNYKKYNFRINLDSEINKWLTLGMQTFLTSSDYSGVTPNISTLFRYQPWIPISDDEGEYYLEPAEWGLNPFLVIQQDDEDKRFNIFGNVYADLKLPFIEGLNYRINYSQNFINNSHFQFDPWGANYTGLGFKNYYQTQQWSLDNIVSYQRTFNDIHRLNLTLVYGAEELKNSFTDASAQMFENPLLGFNRLQAGDPGLFSLSTGAEKENSLYTSARLFYGFRNKYLVTATVRRDGFSGFGAQKKIGVFPSLALAWVASEESFFNISWMNYLKLRGSYGSSGRRAVNRYDTRAIVSSGPAYIFGDGGSASMGQWISKMANEDLGWETTTGINVGADFGFLSSGLRGNVEYYRNNTSDILYAIQLPEMTGFTSINSNIGKVKIWGTEFSLTGNIVNTSQFGWESTLNYSRNRNEIVSVLGPNSEGVEEDLVANLLFIGEPQDVVYDYEITGELWQLADQDANLIPTGFQPGTLKIVDQNDDGAYSATDDRKILGYSDPSYRFGISNRLRFKNLSLYVFINSIQGGKNYYIAAVDPPFNLSNYEFLTQGNGPRGAWDYWMPENPDSKYRRLDTRPSYEGFNYDKRNFIRLQDVTLSYSFNKEKIKNIYLNGLKVFVSGKNLLTITKWEGLDPELGIGIMPAYPVMTNYTAGLNIEF